MPANSSAADLGSANGGAKAKPVCSPAVTLPRDRPHGLAYGNGMAPTRPPDEASLRLFVGTWNMHGKAPPASLVPWLPASPDAHDMYVIGTQEAERSIEKSLIISSKAKWEAALRAHLGDGFVLLSAHTLAAIHIVCFVSVRLLGQVGNVQTAAVATGIGNTLGNKGGVALGCSVGSTSLLFVNVHLSAHQHAVAQRDRKSVV